MTDAIKTLEITITDMISERSTGFIDTAPEIKETRSCVEATSELGLRCVKARSLIESKTIVAAYLQHKMRLLYKIASPHSKLVPVARKLHALLTRKTWLTRNSEFFDPRTQISFISRKVTINEHVSGKFQLRIHKFP